VEIELTIWQRAMLIQVISGMRGDVKLLRQALRALEALDFTEEEREAGEIVEEEGRMLWSTAASETVYTVTLEKPVVRFVRNAAEGFQGWPVGQAAEVLDLLEKLGVKEEENLG